MEGQGKSDKNPVSLTSIPDFFKKLVDNMRVGVIVSDHNGYIIYVNETWAKFVGMEQKKHIGKHAQELGVNSRLHVVAKTGEMEINYPHQFKDIAFLVHRVPIRENGKIIAVLGLVLFDSATTASKLGQKVACLESKLAHYKNELYSLRSTRYTMESIRGESRGIKALKEQAIKAAATNLPVVITGESGTGKELFAQAIHHESERRLYPFVRINCSAIPKDLFESELFGYDKGAFTGASSSGKQGKLEVAQYGSLFLDEIGDLPLETQPKLLRVLEEKEFERVGGTSVKKADFRLLAATNQNLEKMLKENRFRDDLFYRLNVIPLHIPPLRERKEDIIILARHVLREITHDSSGIEIDPKAERILTDYDWPGNVRELYNLLERIVYSTDRNTIYPSDLPLHLFECRNDYTNTSSNSLKSVQGVAERETILHALESTDYNKVSAAKVLGIHRSLLYKKIKKYNISTTRE